MDKETANETKETARSGADSREAARCGLDARPGEASGGGAAIAGSQDLCIPRSPNSVFLIAAVLFAAHTAMCMPSIVSRGHPPIHPFWDRCASFVCYFGVVLFSFVNDQRKWRMAGIIAFLMPAVIVSSASVINVLSARPRIGSGLGLPGILFEYPLHVGQMAMLLALGIVPIAVVLDAIAVKAWAHVRSFHDESSSAQPFRFSLRALFAVMCLVSLGVFAVHLLPAIDPRTD